jgi:hypothetical protein
MRRFAIGVGLAVALAGATAAPAAAQTITPASYDFGEVQPKEGTPLAEFTLKAGATPLNGLPTLLSGNTSDFGLAAGFCDGSLNANQSCIFRVRFNLTSFTTPNGTRSVIAGIAGGPTATITATVVGGSDPGKGSKGKSCKKKGKKSAAASGKKKGCKKKGKK